MRVCFVCSAQTEPCQDELQAVSQVLKRICCDKEIVTLDDILLTDDHPGVLLELRRMQERRSKSTKRVLSADKSIWASQYLKLCLSESVLSKPVKFWWEDALTRASFPWPRSYKPQTWRALYVA